jgi:putative spermidine/putrescine transport system ATP-binding protein
LPAIALRGIRKAFGAVAACDGVDLEVAPGEFLTLLGDSGCGKTTLLRIAAGFTAPDSGAVLVDGVDVTAQPPAARAMGFVFQSYALFPTKTVAQNIGFALEISGCGKAQRRSRVAELADIMELGSLLDRFPHELSGGQQQRVALARALAPAPPILLLDEPLSALDARIRGKLRAELRDLVRRFGLTAIYVTHDQEEALALSDRIAVMRAGRILQLDAPHAIYHRPATSFVAGFIGVSNLIDGKVTEAGLATAESVWPLPAGHGLTCGMAARLLYRPETLRIARSGEDRAGAGVPGTVRAATFLGGLVRLDVAVGERRIVVDRPSGEELPPVGTDVVVTPDPQRAVVFAEPGP